MNKLIKLSSIFAALSLLMSGCNGRSVQAEQDEQAMSKKVVYESVLGKPVTDAAVVDFIASNHCSSVDQFQLCNEVGMAFWMDSNQVVETVYLYVNGPKDIKRYKGELPYGLKFYDIKGAVEYKLNRRKVGNAGLPDESSSPDHFHLWAAYKEVGMTIIYNSPFDDEDATIYAILVNQ